MKDKNNQNEGQGEEFPSFDYEVPEPDSTQLKDDVSQRSQDNEGHVEHLQRETDEALLRLDGRMQSYERQSIEKSQMASTRALTLSWVNLVLLIVFVFFGASWYSNVNVLINKNPSEGLNELTDKQNKLTYKIQLLSEQVESVLKMAKARESVINNQLIIEQPIAGQWIVSLFSFKEEVVAQQQAMKLFDQGIQVAISTVQVSGVVWYRLYVGGFISKHDAEAYAEQTRTMLGLKLAWVAQAQ